MGKNKKKNRGRGRPRPHYRGKPLWQLLDNLPNHGVGRLIIRGSFSQKEDQPSYMRILSVDMASNAVRKEKNGKIRIPVKVERIWRGVVFPRPVNITSTSYLSDFQLVPKHEEEKYVRNTKTASEKGYYYWTESQKKRIKKRIEEGMSPWESKQRELESIAREQAEAAQRDGVQPSQLSVRKLNETNYSDNFDDDVDAEETDESFDSNYSPGKKKVGEKKKTRLNETADDTQRETGHSDEYQSERNIDDDYNNFSKEQKERIEKMIQNGMNPDTAKQMEWERQTALAAATGSGFNKAGAGPSSDLKRNISKVSNQQGVSAKVPKVG